MLRHVGSVVLASVLHRHLHHLAKIIFSMWMMGVQVLFAANTTIKTRAVFFFLQNVHFPNGALILAEKRFA